MEMCDLYSINFLLLMPLVINLPKILQNY